MAPSSVVKEVKTQNEVMRGIRSVKEIAVKIPEFECDPEAKGKDLQCVICSTAFSYSAELEQDFGCEILSDKLPFIHLFVNQIKTVAVANNYRLTD